MKAKTLLPLIIGIVFGFLAIKLSFDAIQRARGSAKPLEMITVVVANTDIDATSELKHEMLLVKKTPVTPLVPPDAFKTIDELVGRVVSKGIPWGSPILPSMLSPKGTKPGLQVRIKEGYRAVAVKIDEVSGVAYNLRPGDYVDVIAVMSVQINGHKQTVSNVILQRVQVGGVGQWLDTPDEKVIKAKSVTLLVKVEDVPRLHLAQSKGKLTLAMRGPNDERTSKFAAATEAQITGQSIKPGAAPRMPTPSGLLLASDQMDPMVPREWVVAVFNGPVRAGDGSSVHRLTYKDPNSMTVIRTANGRTDGGQAGATSESIMSVRHGTLATRRDRGLGGTDRPGSTSGGQGGREVGDSTSKE